MLPWRAASANRSLRKPDRPPPAAGGVVDPFVSEPQDTHTSINAITKAGLAVCATVFGVYQTNRSAYAELGSGHEAAVYRMHGSGYPAGFVGCEKEDVVGDIDRIANPP